MEDIKLELTREEAQTLKSLLVDYFMMKENSDGDMFAGKRMKLTGDFIKKINDCQTMEFSDYRIEQIVIENAHLYFDGRMTAEEAASAIDKDVEAYLASL